MKPDVENSASAFSSSSLVFYRSDIAYTPLTTVGSIVHADGSAVMKRDGRQGLVDPTASALIVELDAGAVLGEQHVGLGGHLVE